jgi:dTDP-4-dehydrorhamnose 3,5-epimerase
MIFKSATLAGVYSIDPERHEDDRGFFARVWCAREFAAAGLSTRLAQCSISLNKRKGTLRGLHYQVPPHEEVKLVRCTRGAVYDVVVDLRPHSPTFQQWTAVTLTSEKRNMLYVPQGVAHGFQTLEDDTELFYQISEFHEPAAARGVRWNDPAFRIEWPVPNPILNKRDESYPDFLPTGLV